MSSPSRNSTYSFIAMAPHIVVLINTNYGSGKCSFFSKSSVSGTIFSDFLYIDSKK